MNCLVVGLNWAKRRKKQPLAEGAEQVIKDVEGFFDEILM